MKIEDAFWFKKVEEVLLDEDAKAGEDAVGVGVGDLELFDGGEIGGGAGVKKEVNMGSKGSECGIGERAVAKEDDFRRRSKTVTSGLPLTRLHLEIILYCF